MLTVLLSALVAQASPNLDLASGVQARTDGDLERAERLLTEYTEASPGDAAGWFELAVTQSWRGRLESSLGSFRRTLSVAPKMEAAHLGEARVLAWLGHLDAAERRFRGAVERQPDSAEALNGLAMVQTLALDRAAARATYQKVFDLDPTNQAARQGLRRLEDLRPTQLRASLGAVSGADGRFGIEAQAFAKTRFGARWGADAEYALSRVGTGVNGVVAGEGATVHRAAVHVSWQGLSTTARFGPTGQAIDGQLMAGVAGDASQRLTDGVTALVGMRLLWPTMLGSAGFVVSPVRHLELIAQYYLFLDPRPTTHAAVARALYQLGDFRVSLGGGPTFTEEFDFMTVAAGVRWAFTSALAVQIDVDYLSDPLEQVGARSSFEWSF